mmetsp:Transcript_10419/g.26234  ORF Transcript_10419/g.26234 Transcript_10419/m.26234 type:complete len:123 (-) Transcript_10419:975-1343(-)
MYFFCIRRNLERALWGTREYNDTAGALGGLANEYNPRSGDRTEATMERFGEAYVTMVLFVVSLRTGYRLFSFFREFVLPGGDDMLPLPLWSRRDVAELLDRVGEVSHLTVLSTVDGIPSPLS